MVETNTPVATISAKLFLSLSYCTQILMAGECAYAFIRNWNVLACMSKTKTLDYSPLQFRTRTSYRRV